MNILPLVFSLLIIFSCLCFTFLRELKSSFLIEQTLQGYHHTEKAIHNALVQKAYDKIKEDASIGPEKKEPSTKSTAYASRRIHHPPLETSKFHLRALSKTTAEPSQHPLYEPFAELLRLLYKKNLFSKYPDIKKPEYQIIEALIKKAQKLPSAKQLFYLYPEEEKLQTLYYKMLKGTNHYTETEGIPPLSHFVSLEPMDKALHVSLASTPVLSSFFGPEMTELILKTEKEHWTSTQKQHALSKKDLETLLMKDLTKASLLSQLQPFLDYSKQIAKKNSVARRDKLTGIGIEKEL